MKRLLYFILKKDIIKKLKKAHVGSQIIDDVTMVLGIPSNLMTGYIYNEELIKEIKTEIQNLNKKTRSDIDDMMSRKDEQIKEIHGIIHDLENKIFSLPNK